MNNWRQAVRAPTPYRVGSRSLRMQSSFVYSVSMGGLAALLLLYLLLPRNGLAPMTNDARVHPPAAREQKRYNPTYPLSPPRKGSDGRVEFRIAAVADRDTQSRERYGWVSYVHYGWLGFDPYTNAVSVRWDQNLTRVQSSLAFAGRGMELSELVVFDGRLLSVDDRTGVVYELDDDKVIPWLLLADGNGRQAKGFKGEWMAVKNDVLYVGGLGKEWTTAQGEVLNLNPQWIKTVTPSGEVRHVDWHVRYNAMREAAGIQSPGYMIHEAAVWSSHHQQWVFLPRRASDERYDEHTDEHRGTNLLIRCNEDFTKITVDKVGKVNPTRGFSSFKFVPNTGDEVIVALKSEEVNGKIATYVTAFHIDGAVILPETRMGDLKFEGIEFV